MKKGTLLISLAALSFSFVSFSQTATFNYTGTVQYFVVPVFITSIDADIRGAEGSQDGGGAGAPGKGGRVQASLSVTPGDTLYIYAGGAGVAPNGGFNGGGNGGVANTGPAGGGGGGMSDIRQGGNLFSDIVAAAAGGGGCGGYNGVNGGDGGGLTGQPGTDGAAMGGGGGTQVSGGPAGTGAGSCGLAGTVGAQWTGGTGGNTTCGSGFGGGGGGGAGYFGGGGGGAAAFLICCPDWSSGGGGGSNYLDSSSAVLIAHTQGYQSGNGQVIISYIITGDDGKENAGNAIVLSPIPATNEITIYDLRFTISELEIYDVLGEKCLIPALSKGEGVRVDVSVLHSGIYFVRIKTDAGISTAKFVKE